MMMFAGLVLARGHSGNYSMDIFRDVGVSEKFFNFQIVSLFDLINLLQREFLVFSLMVEFLCAVLSVEELSS
jgi:hypothetical protein